MAEVEAREEMRQRLIVALDFPSAAESLGFLERLEGRAAWVKVGLELYLAEGPRIVETLTGRGLKVFLDLKLHDIPNTVAGAVRSVSSMGAALLTVHAGGGPAMLEAAAAAAGVTPGAPRLLAVTVLTSMDEAQLAAIGVTSSAAGQVLRLADLSLSAGISGLVCSAQEASVLRERHGAGLMLVVPGIRPAGAAMGDQSRIATPGAAFAAGASMLVVGRPITQASDPAAAFEAILEEMEGQGSGHRDQGSAGNDGEAEAHDPKGFFVG
jgi:orotidine-5'-phosphate decarboxylase